MEGKINGVYFIYNSNTNLIKIGCSTDILSRFNNLQLNNKHMGYGNDLELVDYIPCNQFFLLESYLHKRYKNSRIQNEWFNISKDEARNIKNTININNYNDNKKFNIKSLVAIYTYKNGRYYFKKYNKKHDEKLTLVEKGFYSWVCDFVSYPTNCVIINDQVPTIETLTNIIGIKERALRGHLKTLESKGLIKLVQFGHKKAIYVNPRYYASGKDLDIETLRMFDLIECDENKINSYIED